MRGFTLIELMIATALSTLILGAAYAAFQAVMSLQSGVESRSDLLQRGRVVCDLIARDLRHTAPAPEDAPFVGRVFETEGYSATQVHFTSHHWTPVLPGERDLCEVSYFVRKDPVTQEIALFRRRDPSPDEDPQSGGLIERLTTQVVAFQLDYFDGSTWSSEWGEEELEDALLTSETEETEEQSTPALSFGNAGIPEAVMIRLALGERPEPDGRETRPNKLRAEPVIVSCVVRLPLAGRELPSAGGIGDEGLGEASEPENGESTDPADNGGGGN